MRAILVRSAGQALRQAKAALARGNCLLAAAALPEATAKRLRRDGHHADAARVERALGALARRIVLRCVDVSRRK